MIKYHQETPPPAKPCSSCASHGGRTSSRLPLEIYVTIQKEVTYSNEDSQPPADPPLRCTARNGMSDKGDGVLSSYIGRQGEHITPTQSEHTPRTDGINWIPRVLCDGESGGSLFSTSESGVV